VLSGTIEAKGKNLTLNVTMNDVVEMIANDPETYTAPMSKVLRMEKDILLGIIKQLKVTPAKADESQMLKIHTDNYDAFLAFSKGLRYQDEQLLSSAVDFFKEAYELDPGFELARERFLLIEAMQVISSGLSVTEFIASKHGRAYAISVASPEFTLQTPLDNGTMGRLQRTGYYLNLGQIPGQEYRYEAVDLEFNGISVERKQLLAPPTPPVFGE
ncbi:hypothetical protein KAH55_08175, partial [bacterium]|nr:hypothetical protein [bacterium]